MDPFNGFDRSGGIKLKTDCTTRIRGSILDELRSQDWVPRLVRLKAHKLERATRLLEGQLGRLPNQAELAKELGLTMEELQDHQNEASARTIFSLSEKWDDGDDDKEMEKIEILADKKCENPVETIQSRDALDTITRNHVSSTHPTLPTNRQVEIPGAAVSIQQHSSRIFYTH